MQDDLISVIVPVDNASEYLDRCVESLVNQTYENIEIILVDNASSDDSPIMCDSWTQRDIRVKVIHREESNLAGSKNAGLDYANGEYITFVKANNFVDREYIFTLLKNLEETHSDISICTLTRFIENKKNIDSEESNVEDQEVEDIEILQSEEEVSEVAEELEDIETVEESESEDNDDDQDGDDETDADDSDEVENETDDDDTDSDYNLEQETETIEENTFDAGAQNVKVLEKRKSRSRIVFFEGDDIFDYFFSGVETIKTAPFGKLYKKSIFKNLRFDEDRIFEDEFIAHKIYSVCKKFVRTSSGLYYNNVTKKPLKNAKQFTLKDLDFYYALENRYNYFKDTKWQSQALNQMLIQIANIYCLAKAGKADSNTLKFLKHKYKLYFGLTNKHKLKDKCFRYLPSLFYSIKKVTTKNK